MVSEYPRTKAVRESPTKQALDSAPCHLLVLFTSCPKLALSRLGWAGVAQSLSPVTLNTVILIRPVGRKTSSRGWGGLLGKKVQLQPKR